MNTDIEKLYRKMLDTEDLPPKLIETHDAVLSCMRRGAGGRRISREGMAFIALRVGAIGPRGPGRPKKKEPD